MTTDVKLPEPVACRWRGSGRVHYLRWVYANAGSPSTPPSGAEPLYTADQVRAHAAKLLAENERLRGEVERLTFEMGCLQQQYDERTAYMIVHRGAGLACSDAVRSAYSDEHHRAERLAEALRELLEIDHKFTGDPDEDAAIYCDVTDNARAALDQEGGKGGAGK